MKNFIFLLLLFTFLTAVFLYPLAFVINTHIPGFFSTDEPYGLIWRLWWARYAFFQHMPYQDVPFIASPFGMHTDELQAYPVGTLFHNGLSILTNEVVGYNLLIILSFILSGVFFYYLAFFVSKNKLASLFSAIIFAFCPYHLIRSWQHLRLAEIQWIPLYILALLRLAKDNKLINSLFLALALVLVSSFDYYYAYFISIATLLFVIILLFRKEFKAVKSVVLSILAAALFILPPLYTTIKSIFFTRQAQALVIKGYVRSFSDLFEQSAKFLSYFLPPSFHPVFGGFTEQFVGTSLYGTSFTEHVLYLGWVPLALAFYAAKKSWRKDFYARFFVLAAIVFWLFSQPPWWKIFSIKILMPSFFMYKALPMFRAYSRFGIMVMLSVAVLAGLGLRLILEKFKTRAAQTLIFCLFSGLIFFEFWSWPPYRVIEVRNIPKVYTWLKDEPADTLIAEYPLDTESVNEMFKFYQTRHEKKLINGTIKWSYPNMVSRQITRLSSPYTAGVLKWMGVKYCLVHRDDYINTDLVEEIDELNRINSNPGLVLIKSFPAKDCPRQDMLCTERTGVVDVYEVKAKPQEPKLEE